MQPRRALCLLALLRGLQGLRLNSTDDWDPPQFFACEWEKEQAEFGGCSEKSWVPSRQMDDLLAAGYRRMRTVLMSGRKPLALHIGADGLNNKAKWTDKHLYTRVLERSGLARGALRLAFVEPIADKAENFWRSVRSMPVQEKQVSLHTAMIDGHCKSDRELLYRLSARASQDFDFDPYITQGWVSSRPEHPLSVVDYWVTSNSPIGCKSDLSKDCRANLRRLRDSPQKDSYVEGLSIPCHSLAGVVQEAGSQLRDLSMLVVDAEGLDTTILAAVADQDDFLPGFIMWEVAPTSNPGLRDLQKVLQRKGYTVGVKTGTRTTRKAHARKSGEHDVDAMNFIAVLDRPLQSRLGWR